MIFVDNSSSKTPLGLHIERRAFSDSGALSFGRADDVSVWFSKYRIRPGPEWKNVYHLKNETHSLIKMFSELSTLFNVPFFGEVIAWTVLEQEQDVFSFRQWVWLVSDSAVRAWRSLPCDIM